MSYRQLAIGSLATLGSQPISRSHASMRFGSILVLIWGSSKTGVRSRQVKIDYLCSGHDINVHYLHNVVNYGLKSVRYQQAQVTPGLTTHGVIGWILIGLDSTVR